MWSGKTDFKLLFTDFTQSCNASICAQCVWSGKAKEKQLASAYFTDYFYTLNMQMLASWRDPFNI